MQSSDTSLANKLRGGLFGLAIGDALGAPAEFKPRGTFEPITEYRHCDTFNLAPGEWTDDTAMALCLAHSLIEQQGFDPVDQMDRYVRWFLDGYMSHCGEAIGIGGTTLKSLIAYVRTKEPASHLTAERYSGNGSLMRLAPVVLFYADDIQKAVHYAGESSKTTHGSPIAVDACRYFAYLLHMLLHGEIKEELFSPDGMAQMLEFFRETPLHTAIIPVATGSFLGKNTEAIVSSGYVVHTLEAALWSFYHTKSFDEAVLTAVNLGDDADTVGAVTGQIAGVYYGFDQIGQTLKEKVAWRPKILEVAYTLFSFSNKNIKDLQ